MNDLNIDKSKCSFLKFMAILIPLVIVISYAFFTDNGIREKEMIFHLENTSYINLITDNNDYINSTNIGCTNTDAIDQEAKKKTFKIKTGNNKHNLTYDLSLCELTLSSKLQVPEFKWQLTKDDAVINEGNFDTYSDSINLASGLIIESNSVQEYELKVWLEETEENKSIDNKGIFSGKISFNLVD